MFTLENLPWNCSNNSCLKFARNAQNLPFVNLYIIDYLYDFPSTSTGMTTFRSIVWHKLFLSSIHLLHFVGKILFKDQMASHKYEAMACWLIWFVAVKLTLFKVWTTFLPLLALAGNVLYLTRLNSARCSWRCLIFCCCFSITPTFDGSKWTLLNGAPAKYEDPLDDDACVDISELIHWLPYSMITDVGRSIQSFGAAKKRFCAAFLKLIVGFDQCANDMC